MDFEDDVKYIIGLEFECERYRRSGGVISPQGETLFKGER